MTPAALFDLPLRLVIGLTLGARGKSESSAPNTETTASESSGRFHTERLEPDEEPSGGESLHPDVLLSPQLSATDPLNPADQSGPVAFWLSSGLLIFEEKGPWW